MRRPGRPVSDPCERIDIERLIGRSRDNRGSKRFWGVPGKRPFMEIERETLIEIVVATGAVGLFIAVLLTVGAQFEQGGFTGEGAYLLIGSIAFFVILMAVVGYWLAGQYD